MSARTAYDAVVVGAGPNGLAAAIVLARAGLGTLLIEGEQEPGGGCRSQALTLPGFVHDTCSTVHPPTSSRNSDSARRPTASHP